MEAMSCLEQIKSKIEAEYEIPRAGAEQMTWMKYIGGTIQSCICAHKALRLRTPPFKRFIEEAVPISYFVEQHHIFKKSEITLRTGSQPYDAEVKLSATTEYIEVVNTEEGHLFNLKARLLNKFGVAPGTTSDRIPFMKSLLTSDTMPSWFGDIISGRMEFESCKNRLLKLIEKKINKKYGPGYHLLACFELDMQFDELSELSEYIKASTLDLKVFESISLFERRSASLFQVIP